MFIYIIARLFRSINLKANNVQHAVYFNNQILLLLVLNPDYVTPGNFIMPPLFLFAEGNPDKAKT